PFRRRRSVAASSSCALDVLRAARRLRAHSHVCLLRKEVAEPPRSCDVRGPRLWVDELGHPHMGLRKHGSDLCPRFDTFRWANVPKEAWAISPVWGIRTGRPAPMRRV